MLQKAVVYNGIFDEKLTVCLYKIYDRNGSFATEYDVVNPNSAHPELRPFRNKNVIFFKKPTTLMAHGAKTTLAFITAFFGHFIGYIKTILHPLVSVKVDGGITLG